MCSDEGESSCFNDSNTTSVPDLRDPGDEHDEQPLLLASATGGINRMAGLVR